MRCVQCNRRVGWLRRPVDGLYCGAECRAAAILESHRRQQAEEERLEAESLAREAHQRLRERERLEIEAARLRGTSDVVPRPVLGEAPCPRCESPWSHTPGGGTMGRHLGHCGSCGFEAQFLAIEACPNCRSSSLVVESQDDARCPRCKSHPRRRRQIA